MNTGSNPSVRDLPPIKRMGMVGWFDPAQLLRTGVEVVVSTLFGRHSDSRRLDALAAPGQVLDYSQAPHVDDDGALGFDYVADAGDGWNSTYAVAYALSQRECTVPNEPPLKRGRLLVFGGDLVYPYPTRSEYENRLIIPYSVASRLHSQEPLEVLAIPGNHDWYDSLVNFRRLFCFGRTLACRNTRQNRTYFAAKLPGGWWLYGLDLQLEHEIDELQYRFFLDLAERLRDDERVIACVAEPLWLRRWEEVGTAMVPTLLEQLGATLGARLRIMVAGDLHHYQRHSTEDGQHRITCGIGGAFLHSTHQTPTDPTGTFRHQVSYPDKATSRNLTWRNIRFVRRNPLFGIVPGAAYLLAAWQNGLAVGECFGHVCIGEMGEMGLSRWREAVEAGCHSALLNPIGIALYGLIFWGFVFFADRHSALFRRTVGSFHAAMHVVAGFLVYWFAAYVAITWLGLTAKSIPQYTVTGIIIFVLGWIVGSVILGTYLLVSLNFFGRHGNEAFSSLRIQDWKGFLRFRIGKDGSLSVRCIGIKDVPRKWKAGTTDDGEAILVPANAAGLGATVVDRLDIPAPPAPTR